MRMERFNTFRNTIMWSIVLTLILCFSTEVLSADNSNNTQKLNQGTEEVAAQDSVISLNISDLSDKVYSGTESIVDNIISNFRELIDTYSKQTTLLGISSIILIISIGFLLTVIILKKKWSVHSFKSGLINKRHSALIQEIAENHENPSSEILKRLERMKSESYTEILLDKASEISGKSTRNFQAFYDASGITDRYIKILEESKSWKKRVFAAEKLGFIGSSKAVPQLLELVRDLKDEDADVRTVALRSLGRIKDKRAIPFLIDAFGYPETWLPPRVGEILVNIGNDCIEPLKKELKNFESESKRYWAAEILGWLRADSAVKLLVESLLDVSPEVRARSAGALGKIRSERSIISLTELLVSEPVPFVRTRVSQALGMIGHPSVIHYLVGILKDPEWWVRVRAVEALELLGEKSIPSLLIALEDEDAEVRKRAALALEKIGYIEKILDEYGAEQYKADIRKILVMVARAGVIESLGDRLLTGDVNLQKRIVRILGEAETLDAAEPLIALLKITVDWTLKARIIEGLGKIGANESASLLIHYIKDNEYWVRRSAVEALGMLHAEKYAENIASILSDPNPLARESALRALSLLKVTTDWDKIEHMLFDPAVKVRSTALKVMRNLGIVTDEQKIINMMKESSEEIRMEAIKYFSAIRNENVMPEIIRLLPQASHDLSREIINYIRNIQPKEFSILFDLLKPYKVGQETIASLFEIAAIILDDSAYKFVRKFTSCSDEYLREQAFRFLVAFGYKRNEKLFESALLDPSRAVRAIVLACAGPDSDSNFLNRAKKLAKDPDEDVRLALVLAIGSTGLPELKPLIIEMIDDPSPRVEAGSFIALACFNDPAFLDVFYDHANIRSLRDEIKRIMEDDRFKTVVNGIIDRARKSRNLEVAFIFANNDREFANYLAKRIKESLDPIMRMQAIEILRIIAIPENFTSILSVMKKDPYADVRLQAMDIVVSIGREDEVISALSAALADPEINVRNRAVMLLGNYKNPKALEAMLQVLDTADREFRESVTTSLTHLLSGDPGYIASLVESVPETKTRKIGMAWLMGKSRKKGSVNFLVKLLSDDDPDVRAAAVGALGKFKNKQLINTLEKIIYDPNERVRAAAINAIAATGGERAFEIVSGALEDIDDFVRTRAAIGVARINIKKGIWLIRSKLNKGPELKQYLIGLLFISGESYSGLGEMDDVAMNVVDEVCDKDKMLHIYRQSSDRERRLHAFRVLSLNNGSDSYNFMKGALKDPLPEIREEAQKMLSAK